MRSRGAVAALVVLAVVAGCRELHGPGAPAPTEIYPPLVGQVLDQDGDPLAEAVVRVRYEQPVWREKELDLRVTTNEQGFFSIRVAPDTFRVDIEPPRWSPLPPWTENGVVFDPLHAHLFRFVGHEVRGRLDLGALPDSLWDVSRGWRAELSYLHRWPGGGSSSLTFATESLTDSYRIHLPFRERYRARVLTQCCPDLRFDFTFADSLEPGPQGELDLIVPLTRRELELRVGGRPLAPGEITLASVTSTGNLTVRRAEVPTDGVTVRFTAAAMNTDPSLQIEPVEGDRFLPASVPLEGSDPIVLDLGPHLLQVHVESADGGELPLGQLAAGQENGPRASWTSGNGETHLLRVRPGGVYLQASALGYRRLERFLEINGDRAVTLTLEPQD